MTGAAGPDAEDAAPDENDLDGRRRRDATKKDIVRAPVVEVRSGAGRLR